LICLARGSISGISAGSGKPVWTAKVRVTNRALPVRCPALAHIDNGTAYCVSLADEKLFALKARTGSIVWSSPRIQGLDPWLFGAAHHRLAYATPESTTFTVHWLSLQSGRELEQRSIPGDPGRRAGIMALSDWGVHLAARDAILGLKHPKTTPQ
jgi:hypothetical protein